MLIGTAGGLVIIPLLYVLIETMVERLTGKQKAAAVAKVEETSQAGKAPKGKSKEK